MEKKAHTPLVLVVLDGWGYREETLHNALTPKNVPYFFSLWNTYPHTLLAASGQAVGLPEGQIGTSELGHMILGAGYVIPSDLVRISKAFAEGVVAKNPEFIGLCDHVRANDSTLHIMGLASPGGVHSHHDHLFKLLQLAKERGIRKIAVHAFTDGRDLPPKSGHAYLEELENLLAELGIGRIATVSGRYFAMDRDNNWDRVKKVEQALFHGEGHTHEGKPSELLRTLYMVGKTDEYVEPFVILDDSKKPALIESNDGVFFFNFRPDRARMLSKSIAKRAHAANIYFSTMTEYDATISSHVLFPPPIIETTLASELSRAGYRQVHIAETEKYGHATYFLNGKVEEPHEGEEFVLIESRKDVPTHDRAPAMRAREITTAALSQLEKGIDFIFINYANADMVGHVARAEATMEAVRILDGELKRLMEGIEKANGLAFITADHGNAEQMVDDADEKHTAHTTNPVPTILTKKGITFRPTGTLADVLPTILELFHLPLPPSVTGTSLIEK